MLCKIIFLLLLLAISTNIVQSRYFSCERSDDQCTITGVAPQDTTFEWSNTYYEHGTRNYRTLTILNSTLDDIPAPTSQFKDIYNLNCVGCGLADITKHSFSNIDSLLSLNISVGSHKKLQKNLFGYLPQLTHLNVSRGVIVEIDDKAFSNLAKLSVLDLSSNNISKITPEMFTSLVDLWYLYLSCNHIQILNEGLFISNVKLKYLYLANNDISKIDGVIFSPQHILTIVTLSHNELTALDTANISAERIWINHNKIKRISISNGSSIRKLYMSNNSLTELGVVASLSKLTELDLSYNNIGELNQSSFAALSELRLLNLKSANIGKLQFGVFSHQSKLETLDISYNHIGNIALDMLLAARNLNSLYIDGNNITEFSYGDLKVAFTKFKTIGLGDNDFNCTFLAQAIKQMNSNDIATIVSTGKKVKDSHNINGIGCQVKKEKITPSWIPAVVRTEDTSNTTNTELDRKLDAIIQQVETLSVTKQEVDNTLQKIFDDIATMKQHFIRIDNDILTNKAEILKLELAKINNATNISNTMLWTLINQLNNITLEKQQVNNRAQMQEINELKFQFDKNNYKLSDIAAKTEKLKFELMNGGRALHSSELQSNANSDTTVIKYLCMTLITLVVSFCIYKGYKFVKKYLHQFRQYNSWLATRTNIEMDNNSSSNV